MFTEENRAMIDIEANSHEAQYDNICFMNTTRNNSNAAYTASALEPGLSSGPQHNHGQNGQPTYGQPHEECGDNINTSAGQPGGSLNPPPAYTYQGYPQQPGYPPPPQGYPPPPQGYQPPPQGYPRQQGYPPSPQDYSPPPQGYPPPPQGYPPPPQGYPPPPQGYPPPPQGYPPPPQGYSNANQGVYYSQPVTAIYTVQKSPDKDVVFVQTTTGQTAQVITFYEDPKRRSEFIRKVYTVLFFQLLICSASVSVCVFVDAVQAWVNQHRYLIILFLFFYLASAVVQCCCMEKMLATNAVSIGVLIVLTLSMSGITAFISSMYGKEIILLSMGTTALIVLLLTLLAFQSKYDFTSWYGVMFVILLIFVLFSFLAIFLSPYMPIVRLIRACIGALIMSVYILMDTQMLMSGKRYTLDTDMYIFGAINIFVDIVLLFLYMLDIIGDS